MWKGLGEQVQGIRPTHLNHCWKLVTQGLCPTVSNPNPVPSPPNPVGPLRIFFCLLEFCPQNTRLSGGQENRRCAREQEAGSNTLVPTGGGMCTRAMALRLQRPHLFSQSEPAARSGRKRLWVIACKGGDVKGALWARLSSNERKQPPATEPRSQALPEDRDRLLSVFPHWHFSPAVRLWAPPVSPHGTLGLPILCPAGEDKKDGGGQAAAPARC